MGADRDHPSVVSQRCVVVSDECAAQDEVPTPKMCGSTAKTAKIWSGSPAFASSILSLCRTFSVFISYRDNDDPTVARQHVMRQEG